MPDIIHNRDSRLALRRKLSQPIFAEALRNIQVSGRLRAPLVVDLDPTSFCDLACPDCISKDVLGSSRFDERRLLELGREMADAGVKAVVLIGGGEPLIHRATPSLIRVLTEAGVQVGVVTNGTLLKRHGVDVLRRLTWIRVSVDAGNADTYAAIRPAKGASRTSMFEQVLDGIRHAANSGAAVGYSFVATTGSDGVPSNIREIATAAETAARLGCSYFELKALMNPDHSLANLAASDRAVVCQEYAKAKQLEESHFKVLANSGMQELLRGDPITQIKQYSACHIAELRTLITPSGAYVCSYHRGDPRYKIGDPLKQDFPTFWRTANLRVVDPRVDCSFHCARHQSNEHLAQGLSSEADIVADQEDYFI